MLQEIIMNHSGGKTVRGLLNKIGSMSFTVSVTIRRFFICLVIAGISCSPMRALDVPDLEWLPEPLRAATMRHQSVNFEEWSFSLKRLTGDGTTFEIFDPSLPPADQWQLWMLDGRPPSGQKLVDYLARQKPNGADLLQPLGVHLHESKSLEKKNEKKDLNPGVHDRDLAGVLVFHEVSNEEDRIDYNVDLSRIELEASTTGASQDAARGLTDLMKALHCLVRVHRDPAYIEFFELESQQTFSPMTGVRITSFRVRTDYQLIGGELALPIIHRMHFHIQGRALGIIPFTVQTESEFSDFRLVSPFVESPESPAVTNSETSHPSGMLTP